MSNIITQIYIDEIGREHVRYQNSSVTSCTSSAIVRWRPFPFGPTEQARNRKLLLLEKK